MKKITNVGIGGIPFVLEEDAYERLSAYLANFKNKLNKEPGHVRSEEVMDDLEERIAELFTQEPGAGKVVTIEMVNKVIARLGMPDGGTEQGEQPKSAPFYSYDNVPHKLYRDMDNKAIGGVCSGLAAYFGIDTVLVRLIFIAVFLFGGSGLLIYIIFWIVCPPAISPAQKCELRGIRATAENMSKFSNYGK